MFSLLYAPEWHINDVLAFSHRETSHLPFSRSGCLLQIFYQMVLAEQTCSFINTCENKMQGLFIPFLYSQFTEYVKVKLIKLMNELEGCTDSADLFLYGCQGDTLWLFVRVRFLSQPMN